MITTEEKRKRIYEEIEGIKSVIVANTYGIKGDRVIFIGNVLDYYHKNNSTSKITGWTDTLDNLESYDAKQNLEIRTILFLWKDKTKPIDNEVEVIDYIFPLLPKKGEGFELKGDTRYAGQTNQDYLSKIDLGMNTKN